MSRRWKLLVGTVVVAALAGVSFAGVSLAAGPQGNSTGNTYTGGVVTPCPHGQYGPVNGQQGWAGCQGLGLPIYAEAISNLLGLTPDEIIALHHEGQSLVEIAAAQGVDEATLTEVVLAARAEALQQKVDEGVLTPEQADTILARFEANISYFLNMTPYNFNGGIQGAGPGRMGCGGQQGNSGTINGQTGFGMMGRGGMMGGGMMGRGSW